MKEKFLGILFLIVIIVVTVIECRYPPLCDEAGQFDFVCVELSGEEKAFRKEIEAIIKDPAGEMVSIPAGAFRMGDLSGEGFDDEKPAHSVTMPAFKLGKYEVTLSQWMACVLDGGCDIYPPGYFDIANDSVEHNRFPRSFGSDHPVINVSWDDAQSFIDWLNRKTDGNYRLPTEAEWEYAARAGSTTKYSWGDDIGVNLANCFVCGGQLDIETTDPDWLKSSRTAPVGNFPANAWGLHDMHGNASEWTEDCWNDSYNGAPTDGSAWISGDCELRILRGGSSEPNDEHWVTHSLRSAYREYGGASARTTGSSRGFRLAHDE